MDYAATTPRTPKKNDFPRPSRTYRSYAEFCMSILHQQMNEACSTYPNNSIFCLTTFRRKGEVLLKPIAGVVASFPPILFVPGDSPLQSHTNLQMRPRISLMKPQILAYCFWAGGGLKRKRLWLAKYNRHFDFPGPPKHRLHTLVGTLPHPSALVVSSFLSLNLRLLPCSMVEVAPPRFRRRLVGQSLLYAISVFASLGVFLVSAFRCNTSYD